MRILVIFLMLLALPHLVASQSFQEHRWTVKMESLYAEGDYEKLLSQAEKWGDRNGRNKPPKWVFSYYKSKAHFGLAQQDTGRNRIFHLQKGADLLRWANRRDRQGEWKTLDPEFTAHSQQQVEWLALADLNDGDLTSAYQHYRIMAEVFDETSLNYQLLEDRSAIRQFSTTNRPTRDTLIAWVFLEQINELRASGCDCGGEWMPPAPPVTWHPLLNETARLHSADMQAQNYFDHTGLDGSKPWDRAERLGYSSNTVGENIALGYYHEMAVFIGWKQSPGHCRNMMNPRFAVVGLGRQDEYWTLVFGGK